MSEQFSTERTTGSAAGPSQADTTCGPVDILAARAGCSGVSGPIPASIHGEKATQTSEHRGNRGRMCQIQPDYSAAANNGPTFRDGIL